MANQNGLLQYGENDGSVILRSPLTSLASITTMPIGSASVFSSGTNQLYDAVKGFQGNVDGSTVILTSIANIDKLNYGGQITWQVNTAMLAAPDSISAGSSGGTPQTDGEVFISLFTTPSTDANFQTTFSIFNKQISFIIVDGTAQYQVLGYINDSIGVGDYVTFHVVMNCNTATFFVDGKKFGTLNRSVNFLNAMTEIRFGNYKFGSAQTLRTGFIRNFQISKKIPAISVHPRLARLVATGDSYSESEGNTYIPQPFNDGKIITLTAELRKHGFDIGNYTGQAYGGRTVIGSGNAAVNYKDNIPTVLAQKGTLLILQIGANDIGQSGSLNVAAYRAAMRDFMEQYFGLNGYPFTYTQAVLVCTTPWPPEHPTPSTARSRLADTLLVRDIVLALPAWFNTTYPALSGRLGYRDTFADFGGENPAKNLYGTAGDFLHPTVGRGWYTMGQSWYRGILPLLGV